MLHEEDLEKMQQEKPLVGLLLGQEVTGNPTPQRFLAQIVAVEVLFAQENSDSNSPGKPQLS
jgi:hypothetical protein